LPKETVCDEREPVEVAIVIPEAKTQFLDYNGDPLVNGTVAFFIPGTDSGKNTWNSPEASTVNPNPVVLDAAGRGSIFGDGTNYRQVVRDQHGNLVWDQETGIPPTAGGPVIGPSLSITGSANIGGALDVTGNAAFGGNLQVDGSEAVNGTMTANGGFISSGNSFFGGTFEVGQIGVFDQGIVVENPTVGSQVSLEVKNGSSLNAYGRVISENDSGLGDPSVSVIDITSQGYGMWVQGGNFAFGKVDGSGNPTQVLFYFDVAASQLVVVGSVNVTGQLLVNGVPVP